MELYFCVLEVCPIQLLSISIGIVRSSVRDWAPYSQLSVHTIEKIISDTKVIFSAGMWFYILFLSRNRGTVKSARPRDYAGTADFETEIWLMEKPYFPEQKYDPDCGITDYGIRVFVCMCAPVNVLCSLVSMHWVCCPWDHPTEDTSWLQHLTFSWTETPPHLTFLLYTRDQAPQQNKQQTVTIQHFMRSHQRFCWYSTSPVLALPFGPRQGR